MSHGTKRSTRAQQLGTVYRRLKFRLSQPSVSSSQVAVPYSDHLSKNQSGTQQSCWGTSLGDTSLGSAIARAPKPLDDNDMPDAEASRSPVTELPGTAEDDEDLEAPSNRVRIPARRYRRALAEHLCERSAALRSRGELGVRTTYSSCPCRELPASMSVNAPTRGPLISPQRADVPSQGSSGCSGSPCQHDGSPVMRWTKCMGGISASVCACYACSLLAALLSWRWLLHRMP